MSVIPSWRRSPADLELSPQTVEVWRSRVELPAMQRIALQQCLSTLEIERANRYRVMARREEFIVARGLLRTILARILHVDPREIDFSYGNKGKPSLLAPLEGANLCFNVSHSHGMILIALTLGRAVGIDVEQVRDKTDHQRLAERFFSAAENAKLREVPDEEKRNAFFACWTRKEAFLKATGMGISLALDSFDVAFWPFEDARLLATRWDADEASRWSMKHLVPSDEHIASVAVEGSDVAVRCWDVW